MENNVTSLEISKKLKEAGFKKDSPCYRDLVWVAYLNSTEHCLLRDTDAKNDFYNYKTKSYAYQVNELLAELPKTLSKNTLNIYHIRMWFENGYATISYFTIHNEQLKSTKGFMEVFALTTQDALALMWIWLKENGYIKEEL